MTAIAGNPAEQPTRDANTGESKGAESDQPSVIVAALPETIIFAARKVGVYQLKRSIELELGAEGGQATVTWNVANLSARGSNLGEALDAFQALLIGVAQSNDSARALLTRIVPG